MNTKLSSIKILIVDDEASVRESLKDWFLEEGFIVDAASCGKEALEKMAQTNWDLFFIDMKMPGMSGLELQERIKKINPNSTIIIITAYASVESAILAMKMGAYDYITKPFDPEYLALLVRNAMERNKLVEESSRLKQSLDQTSSTKKIIGESPNIKRVIELIEVVSETDSTVLIRGESGTGKELVARAIHANSKRRYAPMITINCGALPESVLESELFGHEKGAFTGAQYSRKGKFEMADGGSIFLDEIGNISPKIQMELLRVLEEKKFYRVGGSKEISADFRVISATNTDLEAAMGCGEFRGDLYYRLNVFSIEIPPLRDRHDDIELLATHFLNYYSSSMNKKQKKMNPAALDACLNYSWPGNVRELENAMERAMVICQGDEILPIHLPFTQNGKQLNQTLISLEQVQKEHIKSLLQKTDWNITKTASLLGIDRVTLYNKIKKFNLKHEAIS